MGETQLRQLEEIRFENQETVQLQVDYWNMFSNMGTWQFLVHVLATIIPLILLVIFIDKRKMLLLGFFGFSYHVLFLYVATAQLQMGLIEFPYHMIPFAQIFALDAALVPIGYMLLYQWCLNRGKNVYLYALVLSAVFAFVMKPIMVTLDLFRMFGWTNYLVLFGLFYLYFLLSLFVTKLFVWMQRKYGQREVK